MSEFHGMRDVLRLLADRVKSAVINVDFKKTECCERVDAVSYEVAQYADLT